MDNSVLEKGMAILSDMLWLKPEVLPKISKVYRVYKGEMPKGSGKIRTLHIPNEALKLLQRMILNDALYRLPVSWSAHCAISRRSVTTNVTPHLKSRAFFRIDFKDAFPSTTRQMVIDHLLSLIKIRIPVCEDPQALATAIAEFTVCQNFLPQGAPTSSYLFNLVCYALDQRFMELAEKHNFQYTRYSDDLWFSTAASSIPVSIRTEIIKAIQQYGFTINRDKVKYRTGKAAAPKITGVTIVGDEQKKMSIPRKKMDGYRALIHRAINDNNIKIEKVMGAIGWITMITGEIPLRIKKPFGEFLQKRCPAKTIAKYRKLL